MATSIGISGIFRRDQLAGGVYSYCENLLRGFGQLCENRTSADNLRLRVFHGRAEFPWKEPRIDFEKISDRLGRFAAETRLGLLECAGLDAILFTNYFTPPIVRARRTVTVIHDLQYLHLPEFFSPAKKFWLKTCHLHTLRACDGVVTISQTVKDDLLQQYGDRWVDRIHAIWNPVSIDRFQEAEAHPSLTNGRPYLLCAAMDRPQKNLATLIHAFHQIKDRWPDLCLVMTGQLRSMRRPGRELSKAFADKMPSTIDLVAALGLKDRVQVTGFVSDQVLGNLYRGASVFVLPSLFEGFGMPAVESLALGTPTLVSDLPVLREVTLGQAHYVANPRDAAEMADRIDAILADVNAYRPSPELVERIHHRFAPATIAQQYLNLLLNLPSIPSEP